LSLDFILVKTAVIIIIVSKKDVTVIKKEKTGNSPINKPVPPNN
jgi:hypothetical protein